MLKVKKWNFSELIKIVSNWAFPNFFIITIGFTDEILFFAGAPTIESKIDRNSPDHDHWVANIAKVVRIFSIFYGVDWYSRVRLLLLLKGTKIYFEIINFKCITF